MVIKNPGSNEQALVPCIPYQQIMQRCQAANKPAKPVPKAYCQSGNDANFDEINAWFNNMRAAKKNLEIARLELKSRYIKHNNAFKAATEVFMPLVRAYSRDRAAVFASKDSDRIKQWNSTFKPRHQSIKSMVLAGKQQEKLAQEALEDHKSVTKQTDEIVQKMTIVGNAMKRHDCTTAYQLLR